MAKTGKKKKYGGHGYNPRFNALKHSYKSLVAEYGLDSEEVKAFKNFFRRDKVYTLMLEILET